MTEVLDSKNTIDAFGTAPDISQNEVVLGKKLGEGQFGVVYEGKCRGVTVAIKILNQTQMSQEDIDDFKNEVGIMVHLRHPNIVLLMGACYETGKFMIVTELMKMDMGTIIHNDEYQLSVPQKIKFAKDIAIGLAWLHLSKPPILHRDIKPTNILIDNAMNAKLCDFGLSCIRKKKHMRDEGEAPGSPLWMSPEVLLGGNVNEKADVYAYAIVIWELFTKGDPFSEYSELEPFINAVCNKEERPPIPEDMHVSVKEIITKAWDPNPENRPSCSDMILKFDESTLDICLNDSNAKAMWKKLFEGKTEVPYKDFDVALYKTIGEEYPPYPDFDDKHKCLKALILTEKDDHSGAVNLENFGNFLDWFGPCDSGILNRVLNVMREDWFHGDITREEAELKLSDFERKGTYLIRLSTNAPRENPFTLSMVNKNGDTVHLRIKRTKDSKLKLYIKKKGKALKIVEPTVEALVNTAKSTLGLSKPCLGRKYKDIFKKKKGVYMMSDYSGSDDEV